MNNRSALLALHAMQSYRRLPLGKDGRPYGPGFFRGRDWLKGVTAPNRRVSLRLARLGKCIGCKEEVGDGSGDHIIPLSHGGPVGAENYMPLCRRCNASKGAHDLLSWWHSKGRSATELPDDVITAYSRLMFQARSSAHELDDPAPETLERAVVEFGGAMPTMLHAVAACEASA